MRQAPVTGGARGIGNGIVDASLVPATPYGDKYKYKRR